MSESKTDPDDDSIEDNTETLRIAGDIHKFDSAQSTVRFVAGAFAVCFIVWQLCSATVAIATAGKSFWELFFAWLPSGAMLFFGIYRFRRRLSKGLARFLPSRRASELIEDPNRESSKLLADGTHPNDDD